MNFLFFILTGLSAYAGCQFPGKLELPADVKVLSLTGYEVADKKTEVNLTITEKGNIALILSAYESVTWKIKAPHGKIAGIVVVGVGHQKVSSDKSVPIINSSHKDGDSCDVFGRNSPAEEGKELRGFEGISRKRVSELSLDLFKKLPESIPYKYYLPQEINLTAKKVITLFTGKIPPEHDVALIMQKFQEENEKAHREEQRKSFEMYKAHEPFRQAQAREENLRVMKANEDMKRGKEAYRLHLLAEEQKKNDLLQWRMEEDKRIQREKENEAIMDKRIAKNKESLRRKMSPAAYARMLLGIRRYLASEAFIDELDRGFKEKYGTKDPVQVRPIKKNSTHD